jgi:hypothetical protein
MKHKPLCICGHSQESHTPLHGCVGYIPLGRHLCGCISFVDRNKKAPVAPFSDQAPGRIHWDFLDKVRP